MSDSGISTRHRNVQPEGWAPAKGYANGVLADNGVLYVGGQIGWNADKVFESHDFIGQMRQALATCARSSRPPAARSATSRA